MCNSSNLIYITECEICKIQYVRQTKNKLLVRINQYWNINFHKYEGFFPIKIHVLILIKEDLDFISCIST